MRNLHTAPFAGLALLACGIYFIEDGLFNIGYPDGKEFTIGLAFALAGLALFLSQFKSNKLLAGLPRKETIAGIGVAVLLYAATDSVRWLNRGEPVWLISGGGMTVVQLDGSSKTAMVHTSLLERPARWFETGIWVRIQNPGEAKFVRRKLPKKSLLLQGE